jgi:hypothetical protein
MSGHQHNPNDVRLLLLIPLDLDQQISRRTLADII